MAAARYCRGWKAEVTIAIAIVLDLDFNKRIRLPAIFPGILAFSFPQILPYLQLEFAHTPFACCLARLFGEHHEIDIELLSIIDTDVIIDAKHGFIIILYFIRFFSVVTASTQCYSN